MGDEGDGNISSQQLIEEFVIIACQNISNTKTEVYDVQIKERFSLTNNFSFEQIQQLKRFCFPNKSFITANELK